MTLQDLLDHASQYPELPRPVPPVTSPEWRAWHKAMTAWIAKKKAMEEAQTPKTEPLDRHPQCTKPTEAWTHKFSKYPGFQRRSKAA